MNTPYPAIPVYSAPPCTVGKELTGGEIRKRALYGAAVATITEISNHIFLSESKKHTTIKKLAIAYIANLTILSGLDLYGIEPDTMLKLALILLIYELLLKWSVKPKMPGFQKYIIYVVMGAVSSMFIEIGQATVQGMMSHA